MIALLKQPPIVLMILLGIALTLWTYHMLTYLLARSVPAVERADNGFTELEDEYRESELEARLRRFEETVDLAAFCRSDPEPGVPLKLVAWSSRARRSSE